MFAKRESKRVAHALIDSANDAEYEVPGEDRNAGKIIVAFTSS